MRKRSKIRVVQGIVSAIIVCFFTAHGLLGSFAPVFAYTSQFRWVVWVGVGFVALHVLLSVATSYEQMTDAEFPPSARKKRHLVLKWASGGVLAATIAVHIACVRVPGVFAAVPFAPKLSTIALAAALAWHVCVGMKSLLSDIGLNKRWMGLLRGIVCALAVSFALASLVS